MKTTGHPLIWRGLNEGEWKFENVPDVEIFPCHLWEYSRTAVLESHSKAADKTSDLPILPGPFDWPWPHQGWSGLDDLIKSWLATLMQDGIRHRSLSPIDLNRIRHDSGAYETEPAIVAFDINWAHSDKHLRDCFEDWLKKNRPNGVRQEARGRGAPLAQMKEDLEALGIYRIIEHHDDMTVTKLIEIYADRLAVRFGDEAAWSRAKKRAQAGLKRFRPDRR